MKTCYQLTALLALLTSCNTKPQIHNGYYVGYEEMCNIDSAGKKHCYGEEIPGRKWYHKISIRIINDSVYAEADPISIGAQNDTAYSASDGAFFYYRGKLHEDTAITLNLKEVYCDYCARPVAANPNGKGLIYLQREKIYQGHFKDSNLVLNGIVFTKTTNAKKTFSERLPENLLNTQP